MLYYLDAVVVIYAVEGGPVNQPRAVNYLSGLERAGHHFIVGDLTWAECLVPVIVPGSGGRLAEFFEFFHAPYVRTVSLTTATCIRAAAIRGQHKYAVANPQSQQKHYRLADALHLATAIESGCDRFLTNDARLVGFPDITVEVLPP